MLKTFTLKNGIKVATYNMPSLKSVHIRENIKGGSIMENESNNGVAHFMEHMIVQGVPSFPTGEGLSEFIESMAGSYNATTEKLQINFNITTPFSKIEDALRIASEVFFAPLFTKESLENERRAVLNEIGQRMDAHWYKLNNFFRNFRFKKGPLILDDGGSIDVVNKLTRDDLILFWQKYFLPKNSYLTITGNISDVKLEKLLEKYFGKYKSAEDFPGFPKITNRDFSKRGVAIRKDKTSSVCYMDLTFPSIGLAASLKMRVKQNLLLTILGGLRNSRLFKLLRYQKGLVYNANSGQNTLPKVGMVYISSEAVPEHLTEVVTLVANELAAFIKNGPTDGEVNMAKNYLVNSWLMTFDHPSSVAGWIENDLLWEDRVGLPEDYAKLIAETKAEELIELMTKCWNFDKLNLCIQGPVQNPKDEKDKFSEILKIL